MSVCTNVEHFDPTEAGAETVEWFHQMGIAVPDQGGRAPRFDELLAVLRSFAGVRVDVDMHGADGESFVILFGERYSDIGLQLEGSVDPEGTVSLWFRGGGNEWTMLTILKRLSRQCGPLMMWTELRTDFSIITSDTDVAIECKRRSDRWNADHPSGPKLVVIRPPPPIAET